MHERPAILDSQLAQIEREGAITPVVAGGVPGVRCTAAEAGEHESLGCARDDQLDPVQDERIDGDPTLE